MMLSAQKHFCVFKKSSISFVLIVDRNNISSLETLLSAAVAFFGSFDHHPASHSSLPYFAPHLKVTVFDAHILYIMNSELEKTTAGNPILESLLYSTLFNQLSFQTKKLDSPLRS